MEWFSVMKTQYKKRTKKGYLERLQNFQKETSAFFTNVIKICQERNLK